MCEKRHLVHKLLHTLEPAFKGFDVAVTHVSHSESADVVDSAGRSRDKTAVV